MNGLIQTGLLRTWVFCVGLFVCASCCQSTTAQEKEKEKPTKALKIRWYGQSFFHVETADGTKIVFDPHAMPEYGRHIVQADLILCSHLHNDHAQPTLIEPADKNTKEPKILYGLNVKDKGKTWANLDEKFKNVKIRNVPCYHDEEQGLRRGKNSILIVETDGLKIAHLGDLGHALEEDTLKAIGPVDILMIPVGGIYTINGEVAREVVKQIKPRLYILPMHYGTKVFDGTQGPEEFLEGQKQVRKIEENLLTVPLDLKADFPTIVLMGWSNN